MLRPVNISSSLVNPNNPNKPNNPNNPNKVTRVIDADSPIS